MPDIWTRRSAGHAETLLEVVEMLTKKIDVCDKELERISKERFAKKNGAVEAGAGSGLTWGESVYYPIR